ncbi:hypothetical protein ACHHV8_17410 [Paenibacillus sp. TAB 01]|uniref:hypothetical protein n=1 Tax=Paenibacillus sp. TAB 01 TaxID=3368988 RepID=UPI0037510034
MLIPNEGKAIIIGGSIAGLMTAKAVSQFFEEILIIDKDEFSAAPENRAGTPQAFHPHRFTQRGKLITEKLFPGYEEDLLAQGAPSSFNKIVFNMNAYGSFEGKYPRHDIKFSRAVLEWVLRQRVMAMPQVRVLTKCDVVGLLASPDGAAVNGVRVRRTRSGKGGEDASRRLGVRRERSGLAAAGVAGRSRLPGSEAGCAEKIVRLQYAALPGTGGHESYS